MACVGHLRYSWTMDDPRDPADLTGLDASAVALNRTVDALTTEELAEPSLLPGWTRAHVVAHLALNGRAFAGVLDGVGRGHQVAMYESDEQRDADIEEYVAADPSDLRDALLAATTELGDAVGAMDGEGWRGSFARTPGGATWPVSTVVTTRRREVEIHHVDLGTSYTPRDWPDDFVVELLDAVTVDHAGDGPFRIHATDLDRGWTVGGEGGPVVRGTGADLGLWLTGRGNGEGLGAGEQRLPELGPWVRATPAPG